VRLATGGRTVWASEPDCRGLHIQRRDFLRVSVLAPL